VADTLTGARRGPKDAALILASASPRRIALLKQLVGHFQVIPSDIDESLRDKETPTEYALRVSRAKAEHVCSEIEAGCSASWILAADTIVVIDRTILGKPGEEERARRMLQTLQGRDHEVITGVCLIHRDEGLKSLEAIRSRVWIREMGREEIDSYIKTGEPLDKAGAYAIQGLGARFVTRIEGSYTNVVGLPVERIYEIFCSCGIS